MSTHIIKAVRFYIIFFEPQLDKSKTEKKKKESKQWNEYVIFFLQ